jgi:hypothetical protein
MMTPARVTWASNFTLQRTMGSRCSPLAAERGRSAQMVTVGVERPGGPMSPGDARPVRRK